MTDKTPKPKLVGWKVRNQKPDRSAELAQKVEWLRQVREANKPQTPWENPTN